MVACAVDGCPNKSSKTRKDRVGYFRIPKVIEHHCNRTRELSQLRRNTWLKRLNFGDCDRTSKLLVCGFHFVCGLPSKLFDHTNQDWAPSVGLGTSDTVDSAANETTKEIADEPQSEIKPEESLSSTSEDSSQSETSVDNTYKHPEFEIQVSELPTRNIHDLKCPVTLVNDQTDILQVKILDTELSEQAFQDNVGKVGFYTGFATYPLLMLAFNYVKVSLTSSFSNLTQFQEFILFMLRIRLNLPLRALAYKFNVPEETASMICDKWLDAMYVRVGCVINWPDREELRKTLSPNFQTILGNRVVVIVDCFEVSIDRPTDGVEQGTWPNYKNNTVKYLIGITPQGVISFISEACGGSASNVYITEHSGLLKNLNLGDMVLANRDFGVAECAGFCCSTVVQHESLGPEKRLVAVEVRQIGRYLPLKVYVDKEIGLVKNKYHILQNCLPVEYLTCRVGEESSVIDKIVTVCCALSNLSKSLSLS